MLAPSCYRTPVAQPRQAGGAAAACRHVLVDLEEADILAADGRPAARYLTAPVITGENIHKAGARRVMNEYQTVSARLYLLDRPVNLIDEGIDVALRIAHLADSSFTRSLGEFVALSQHRQILRSIGHSQPADLAKRQIIAMTHFGLDSWSFPLSKVRPFKKPSSSRRGWSSTRSGGGRLSDGRTRGPRLFPITSPRRSGKAGCRSCSARTNTRRCRFLPAGAASPVPKVRAFVDAVPRLSGTSRG
jgi:hypothetical protein